jgi:hypothetical protein
LLREEKRGVLSVRRPSCPPPRRGFEGTGPFLSVWRDGGAKLSSRRSKKLREPVALFPLLLVPSSSLLRPRHASPFRRPRSRDYRQRDRSLLASYFFAQHQNRDQPSQLALRRPKHKSTTRRHMPRVISWAREIRYESPKPGPREEKKKSKVFQRVTVLKD